MFLLYYQDQYDQMMAEKYPDAGTRPDFDPDLWVTASGGAKKGYVKGLGFKRSRPSNFTTCTTASSSVGGSTVTSAAPTSQQAAQEMVKSLCTDKDLLRSLQQALLSTMSAEDIGVFLAARAQSQGSANTEVTHYKFFHLMHIILFFRHSKFVSFNCSRRRRHHHHQEQEQEEIRLGQLSHFFRLV